MIILAIVGSYNESHRVKRTIAETTSVPALLDCYNLNYQHSGWAHIRFHLQKGGLYKLLL